MAIIDFIKKQFIDGVVLVPLQGHGGHGQPNACVGRRIERRGLRRRLGANRDVALDVLARKRERNVGLDDTGLTGAKPQGDVAVRLSSRPSFSVFRT